MNNKKLTAGLLAFVIVFSTAIASAPYAGFAAPVSASAETLVEGRTYLGEKTEEFKKAAFDVTTEFWLVDINGNIIPLTTGEHKCYEDNVELIDELYIPVAEFQKIINGKNIVTIGSRTTVKDLDNNKSYYLKEPKLSAYICDPETVYTHYFSRGYSQYTSAKTGEPAIGHKDADGVWHDDVISSCNFDHIFDTTYTEKSCVCIKNQVDKSLTKVKDMSADDLAARPKNRPALTDLNRETKMPFDISMKVYALDTDGEKHYLEDGDQPDFTENRRFICDEYTVTEDMIAKVCPLDKFYKLMMEISSDNIPEGKALQSYPTAMVDTERFSSDRELLQNLDVKYFYGYLGNINEDGTKVTTVNRELYSKNNMSEIDLTIIFDKENIKLDAYEDRSKYIKGFTEKPFDYTTEFFLIDKDGKAIPVDSSNIERTEDDTNIEDTLFISYEDFDALRNGRDILGIASRVTILDMDENKTYYTHMIRTDIVNHPRPDSRSQYLEPYKSLGYYAYTNNEDCFAGMADENGVWHDQCLGYCSLERIDVNAAAKRNTREYDGYVLFSDISKRKMKVTDMSDADKAARPAQRPVERKVDDLNVDLPVKLGYEISAVDFDGVHHKMKNQPDFKENGLYVLADYTVTPADIAEVCDLSEFSYLSIDVIAPELKDGETVAPGVELYVLDEQYKPDSKSFEYDYIASKYKDRTIGELDPFGDKVSVYEKSIIPVVASRIDYLESATVRIVIAKDMISFHAAEGTEQTDKPDKPEKPDKSKDETTTDEETTDTETTPTDSEDILLGDVNADGKITVTDLSKVAAHIKTVKMLDEDQQKRADVNTDKKITVTDLSKIAAHVKGIKQLG